MFRTYRVIATYKTIRYGNFGRDIGYEVEVNAETKKKAISIARRKVRDMGWDRHEGPLIYTAEQI